MFRSTVTPHGVMYSLAAALAERSDYGHAAARFRGVSHDPGKIAIALRTRSRQRQLDTRQARELSSGVAERRSQKIPTYVLIHGAGDSAWYWHLVTRELRARGHDVVAVDLPCEDDSAGLSEYADAVVTAIGDRRDLVVVAQSFGGYTAPLICARLPVELLVLVAAMVPAPGESAEEMFVNTDYEQETQDDTSDLAIFYHDVPPNLAAEAMTKGRNQSETPWREPWPLGAWPQVPTRYLLCRNDRVFPAMWTRRVVRDRLGIKPDEIESGHCPALSRPKELADRLEAWTR